jgi:hypothetical protein
VSFSSLAEAAAKLAKEEVEEEEEEEGSQSLEKRLARLEALVQQLVQSSSAASPPLGAATMAPGTVVTLTPNGHYVAVPVQGGRVTLVPAAPAAAGFVPKPAEPAPPAQPALVPGSAAVYFSASTDPKLARQMRGSHRQALRAQRDAITAQIQQMRAQLEVLEQELRRLDEDGLKDEPRQNANEEEPRDKPPGRSPF